MNPQNEIHEKIQAYLNGEETPEGKVLFEKWFNSFEGSETSKLNQADKLKMENEMLSNIKERISEHDLKPAPFYKEWLKVAASLAGLLLIVASLYRFYLSSPYETVATGYGETKSVMLPDGSSVVLNANSTIRYASSWEGTSREVLLDGEAYFSVIHTKNHEKFFVKTGGKFDVQVLGTRFTVYNREKGARVVLNCGKVKLNSGKEVILQPGELAQYDSGKKEFLVTKVNADMYSSWKEKKLVFNNTSLQEIASILEDTYGVKVIAEQSLMDQKVSGSVPSDNLNSLIFGLSESFGYSIQKGENSLIFTKSKLNENQ